MKRKSIVVVASSLMVTTSLGLFGQEPAPDIAPVDRLTRESPLQANQTSTTPDFSPVTRRFTTTTSGQEVVCHGIYLAVDHLELEERRSLFVSLDALRYTRDSRDNSLTKFDAICAYDSLMADDPAFATWTCSPMLRDSLALGVGGGVAFEAGPEVGADVVASAAVGASGGLDIGVGMEFPLQRRFKYPLGGLQAFRAPGRGGNVLLESGVGSVGAGQTIIVRHTPDRGLTGKITYVFTHPNDVAVIVGVHFRDGSSACWRAEWEGVEVECPESFKQELSAGYANGQSATLAGSRQGKVDFEMAELEEAMDDARDTLTMIKDDIQQRMLHRVTEIIETFGEKQDEFFTNIRDRAEEGVQEKLELVREIARGTVCPSGG